MFLIQCFFAAAVVAAESPPIPAGYIGGEVVSARDGAPVSGAEVMLFAGQGREFVPVAKDIADEEGKFFFSDLLIAANVLYKLGANWSEIHYPGPVVRLTPARTTVGLKLTVNEAVSEPNLLYARIHEMILQPKPGLLEVSERLVLENPTVDCYVGKAAAEGEQPETLCLNIPATFDQVTFDEEFYGRNFAVSEGRLVTSIPWTPGQRELRFTYTVPNDQSTLTWVRRMDRPCRDVTVRVVTDTPSEVTCSLEGTRQEEPGAVIFRHTGSELAATHKITVELGTVPVSHLAYGKWIAAALLAILVVAVVGWRIWQGSRSADPKASASESIPSDQSISKPHWKHRAKSGDRGGKRR